MRLENGRPLEHDLVGEQRADAVEIVGEVQPDLEMRVERQDGNPIRRGDPCQQPIAVHQKAQKPERPAVHQALLHHDDDQLAAIRRIEETGDLARTEVFPRRSAVIGVLARIVSDPGRGFDADRLIVDPHLEIVGLEPPDRAAVVVDHPHVDDHAGDVDTLDNRLRLGRALAAAEAPERRERRDPTAEVQRLPGEV